MHSVNMVVMRFSIKDLLWLTVICAIAFWSLSLPALLVSESVTMSLVTLADGKLVGASETTYKPIYWPAEAAARIALVLAIGVGLRLLVRRRMPKKSPPNQEPVTN